MDKDSLRKKIVAQRKNLKHQVASSLSRLIFNKVKGLFVNKTDVLIYIPINNEVETFDIIDSLIIRGKKVYAPAFDESKDRYVIVKFESWEKTVKGPYGILQPTGNNVADDIDVAVIPGVAFSKKGVRLGYGKGIYDRLLAESKALKIGVAFDFQVVDDLPQEKHDLVMDFVVSEKNIYM